MRTPSWSRVVFASVVTLLLQAMAVAQCGWCGKECHASCFGARQDREFAQQREQRQREQEARVREGERRAEEQNRALQRLRDSIPAPAPGTGPHQEWQRRAAEAGAEADYTDWRTRREEREREDLREERELLRKERAVREQQAEAEAKAARAQVERIENIRIARIEADKVREEAILTRLRDVLPPDVTSGNGGLTGDDISVLGIGMQAMGKPIPGILLGALGSLKELVDANDRGDLAAEVAREAAKLGAAEASAAGCAILTGVTPLALPFALPCTIALDLLASVAIDKATGKDGLSEADRVAAIKRLEDAQCRLDGTSGPRAAPGEFTPDELRQLNGLMKQQGIVVPTLEELPTLPEMNRPKAPEGPAVRQGPAILPVR